MKRLLLIVLVSLQLNAHAQNKVRGIGQWRGHYDNHQVIQVVKGDMVYAASPYQIIGLDATFNKTWIDKTVGLHETAIRKIAWDANSSQLIIGYANSNLDILKGDEVFNINAIQLSNLYPNRQINAIQIKQSWALIATNFGIVIIDLLKHEIKDTWYPNNNQQATATYNIAFAKDSIYAVTENGLWASPFNNNWIVPNAWSQLTDYNAKGISNIIAQHDNIFVYSQNEVYQVPFTKSIVNLNTAKILNIDTSTAGLNISVHYLSNKGAVLKFNNSILSSVVDSNQLVNPVNSLVNGTQLWIADSSKGLLLHDKNDNWIPLGGPNAKIGGEMNTNASTLLAPFGNSSKGFAVLNEDGWTQFSQINNVSLPNLNSGLIHPLDESYWFSSNTGIQHIYNNNTKWETIVPNQNRGSYLQLQLDENTNIWALQNQQGLVKQINNNWTTIPLPSTYLNDGIEQFKVNQQGQAWIIAPNNQGIYVYQSKDIYATEGWKQLTTQSTNGNLPSLHVTSIANDKAGSIWVGTDNGIGILNCGDITNTPCNAYLPIVSNNGFNGYLFQHEIVRCIEVDGANRKWIGTNNGAWLLSADGLEIIEHFTALNSPLPNDTVLQIAILPTTGEVFFNTASQLVSYSGTATEGKQTQGSIQIFPNPIPPSFNGIVAIRGLVDNAFVKITDLTGKLLYQTQALGGQAVWNSQTYEGKKAATGIYLVFVRDTTGKENAVGKIVIAAGY